MHLPDREKAVPVPPRKLSFDGFVLDIRSRELRKHGVRIRAGQQTIEILLMLLERPGDVVLRQEIRERLWPDDTVVEFEHSINAAVQKLRDALGEKADKPRYIETLKGRGYRFIGTVETQQELAVSVPPPPPQATPAAPAQEVHPAVTPPPRTWSLRLFVAAAAAAAVVALVGWRFSHHIRPPVQNWTLPLGAVELPIVSPDGSTLVYRKQTGLVVRRLDSVAEVRLTGIKTPIDQPAWSPDGSQIVFPTLDGIVRMPVPNGPPAILAPVPAPTRGMSWSVKGVIVVAFTKPGAGELALLPADGGNPAPLPVPGLERGRFYEPQFLPNGEDLLFGWESDGDEDLGIYQATIMEGKVVRGPTLLRRNRTAGHFSASAGGRLLFVQDDKLYVQQLNARDQKLEGNPQRLLDGVYSVPSARRAHLSVSPAGVLAWRSGTAALSQATWFDRTGTVLSTAGPPSDAASISLSPDEKHLLVAAGNRRSFILDAARNGVTPLPGLNDVHWMRGTHLLYRDMPARELTRLLIRAADGGTERVVGTIPGAAGLLDVSRDGTKILYSKPPWELHELQINGSSQASADRLLVHTRQSVLNGRFSPDARWVVYTEADATTWRIYLQGLANLGIRKQISGEGGRSPVWRADGKEIVYQSASKLYSVRVQAHGRELQLSEPVPLFQVRLPPGLRGNSQPLAVSHDGTRILFMQGTADPQQQLSYVMTNWESALR